MRDDNLIRLLHRFAATAKAHHQALNDMDEDRANTHAQMIAKLYQSIIGSEENSRQALLELVNDKDPVVSGMAAVYSIRLDSKPCLAALGRVGLEPGLLGFRARVAIERWESGEWLGPEE